jgi:YidC/Oxa1 family membrane protein insertase
MSLNFVYAAVSWVLLRWHQLFVLAGLEPGSGLAWSLSIVFLVVTVRALLFRLVLKQVQYQRKMQALQPQLAEIKRKYQHDRARQQREIMALQQKEGFNPLAGCLPALLQIPVFIALLHVLRHLSDSAAAKAKLFGAPLAASLHTGGTPATIAVTLVLVLVSAGATLYTQRLIRKDNPIQPVGMAATVSNLMLVGAPLSVLISGAIFPLGVVLYWCTSNLWTMAQQLYINRAHPRAEPARAARQ